MTGEVLNITVRLDCEPPRAVDFAIHMMRAEHDAYRDIWPDPRERWRWLYWLARFGGPTAMDTPRPLLATPPFSLPDGTWRLSGSASPMGFVGAVSNLRRQGPCGPECGEEDE